MNAGQCFALSALFLFSTGPALSLFEYFSGWESLDAVYLVIPIFGFLTILCFGAAVKKATDP